MDNAKKIWRRLDNAALIFPASKKKGWYNKYRISATLKDDIDINVLQKAVNIVCPRFPLICARLKSGVFWYYLEQTDAPTVLKDGYQPLMVSPFNDVKKCAIRILYHNKRVAVEFFHSVTDGTGALVFVKTLISEYIRIKYAVSVPFELGVLDVKENAKESELEDSFSKYRGKVSIQRSEGKAFKVRDKKESDGYLNLTVGEVSANKLKEEAKKYGVTVTAYLSAVLIESIINIQKRQVKNEKNFKPVKIQIPVNLRNLFKSETLRNFVMVVNVGVDVRLGEYTFEEIVKAVYSEMNLKINSKNMRATFTTNVNSEKNKLNKIMPLFVKNVVMKMIFEKVGEVQACMNLSNLGEIQVPVKMKKYVDCFDFIIGPQANSPHNVSVCTYNGRTRINFINGSVSSYMEKEFFTNLVKKGFHVKIESNRRV